MTSPDPPDPGPAGPAPPGSPGAAPSDPTLQSRWRGVRELFRETDAGIAELYAARGVHGVSPRYSIVLIKLARHGPLTIRELAAQADVTHSALSQTVAGLRRDGLVESAPGRDARTRVVRLTGRGRDLVPFLEAEWRATEAAVAELDAEVPYPLAQVVADLRAALARRGFAERVAAHLPSGSDAGSGHRPTGGVDRLPGTEPDR